MLVRLRPFQDVKRSVTVQRNCGANRCPANKMIFVIAQPSNRGKCFRASHTGQYGYRNLESRGHLIACCAIEGLARCDIIVPNESTTGGSAHAVHLIDVGRRIIHHSKDIFTSTYADDFSNLQASLVNETRLLGPIEKAVILCIRRL